MSETYLVEPDVGFIEEVSKLGGQDLKKCYQCATCSVVCPISPDTKPFPRKEMIAASWGLKDRLVGNGDIWLCHNCGDCTTHCPRGAKPGDVMAALRAYTVADYAKPRALGRFINDSANLPKLFLVPFMLFLVVGLLLKAVGVNWLNFAPTGDELWQADYISNYLVDIIMVPTFFAAVTVFAIGLARFMKDIHANALLEVKTRKQKFDPAGFVQALKQTVPTILKHHRFSECGTNNDRATPHMMVLFSFIALFGVTTLFFIADWVFHIEGPYSQINPIKFVANTSGISLLIGGALLALKRLNQKDQVTGYKDWYLLGLVVMLGGTGLLTEMLRLGGSYSLMALVYMLHLMLVWSLFAYTPFSKLAHLVYRTVAMTYQEYSRRK